MAIIKMNYVNKEFTDVVSRYIEKGYNIYTKTMSGHQGEIAKIDLENGKNILRVCMDRDSIYTPTYVSTITIKVEKFDNFNTDILWNGKGTIINTITFYIINDNDYKNPIMTDSREEFDRIMKIKNNRLNSRFSYSNYDSKVFNKKYNSIVLSFINRQPKCKSVKIKDIDKIEKRIYRNKVEYCVFAKGKKYQIA